MRDMRILLNTGIHPDDLARPVLDGRIGRQKHNPEIIKLSADSHTDASRVAGIKIHAGAAKRTKHNSAAWAEIYDRPGATIASTHKHNPVTIPVGAAFIRLVGDCSFDYRTDEEAAADKAAADKAAAK